MTRADEETSMKAVGGDSVCRLKCPIWEDGLHDFKAMRDPVDAVDERLFIHAWLGRGRKGEYDLWLYARLGQAAQGNLESLGGEILDRIVVDIAPDRCVDAVFRPN